MSDNGDPGQSGIRVCNVPDHVGLGQVCGWPDVRVPWALVALVPGVTEDEYRQCVTWALGVWASASGLRPGEVDSARLARILVGSRRIDGPSGVLGECELPCGSPTQVRLWLDTSDSWDTSWPPTRSGRISMYLTVLHEIGHGLGLSHAPAGVTAIMSPTLQQQLRSLQPWDIQEIQRRYGRPTTPTPVPTPNPVPTPTPTPTPGGNMDFLGILMKLFTFFKDNPELLELLKRLLTRASTTEKLTVEDVIAEANSVMQLRA